jgi:hypothetical protein
VGEVAQEASSGRILRELASEFFELFNKRTSLNNMKGLADLYLRITSTIFSKQNSRTQYISKIRERFGERLKNLEMSTRRIIKGLESYETQLAKLGEIEVYQSFNHPINKLNLGLFLSLEEILSHSTMEDDDIPF